MLVVASILFVLARVSPGAKNSVEEIALDLICLAGAFILTSQLLVGSAIIAAGIVGWMLMPQVEPTAMLITAPVVVFAWAVQGEQRVWLAAATLFAESLIVLVHADDFLPIDAVASVASFGLAWGVGEIYRQFSAEADLLRTEHQRAILEFRVAIARELHDTLAQSQAFIAASSADMLDMEGLPDAIREGLNGIMDEAGEASRDLRALLQVLRDLGQLPASGQLSRTIDIDETLAAQRDRLEAAGFSVVLTNNVGLIVSGTAQVVSKILVELVSNVLRHGVPGPVEITVAQSDSVTELRVTNRCRRAVSQRRRGCFGLVGVEERARLLGGSMSMSRPRPDAWCVAVAVPHTPESHQ